MKKAGFFIFFVSSVCFGLESFPYISPGKLLGRSILGSGGGINGSVSGSEIGYFYDGVSVGNLNFADANTNEASGITNPTLPANAGYLWFQADGSIDNVYAIKQSTAGNFGVWAMSGINGTDFEDLTSVRVGTTSWLCIADMGDNSNNRSTFSIVCMREPTITGSDGTIAAGDIKVIFSSYPATGFPSHRDAECLMADPSTGDLYIISKRFTPPGVYKLPYEAEYSFANFVTTWTYMGAAWAGFTLDTPFDGANGGYVTGCNIRPDGKEILIRNHDKVWMFERYDLTKTIYDTISSTGAGGRFLQESVRGGRPSSIYNNEPQAEAITFDEDGEDFWTVSEAGSFDATGAAADNFPLRMYDRFSNIYSTVSLQVGANGFISSYDTYVQSTTPTTNYGITISSMICDEDATDTRVPFIKFGLTGVIPYQATITGADLLLYINTEGQDFTVHKMLIDWNESATYNTVNPGGGAIDRDNVTLSVSSEATHGSPTSVAANHGYNALTGQVKIKIPIATVQAWISGTASNYGWAIFNAGTSLDGFQFSTKENVTTSQRPTMVIRYHGGFTPEDLSITRWWSGSYELNETVPVSTGSVTSWPDRSSSNDDAAQAVAASTPTYIYDANNLRPAIQFDGTNDFMDFTQVSSGGGATIVFVGTNTVYGPYILSQAGGTAHIWNDSATETHMVSVGGTTVFTHTALTPYDVQIFRIDANGLPQHWVNGIESTRSGVTSQIFTADRIGSDGSSFFNGRMADLLIATSGFTNSQVNQLGNYFAWCHNKTWTTIP